LVEHIKSSPLISEIELYCEVDEQWSFVQSKAKQRWLWYAWSPQFKQVLAYHLGRRTDASCRVLMKHLEVLPIKLFCTDDWGAYQRQIPKEVHLISKSYTQNIERNNLNLRTRLKRLARRTICFSKSVSLHDKVIGTLINREWFQPF
jgi:insertion element IS1 protein InsB